jgi:virulence-associated protein VagC
MFYMQETIFSRDALPAHLFTIIHTDKVRVRKDGEVITLTPVNEPYDCTARVFGMYADGKTSTDAYSRQKQCDKEFE